MFALHFSQPGYLDPAFWFMVVVLGFCGGALVYANVLRRRNDRERKQ